MKASVLMKDPRFIELCDQLSNNTRHYDSNLLLTQLNFLTKLDLPTDATILFKTLQVNKFAYRCNYSLQDVGGKEICQQMQLFSTRRCR